MATLIPATPDVVRGVRGVLEEPGNGRVDIRIGGLTLDGSDLGKVSEAIRDRKVAVVTGAMGTQSEYDVECNTIRLSSNVSGIAFAGLVIHEAVHASFDMRAAETKAVDEEVVCYLAMATYFRLHKDTTQPYTPALADLVLQKRFGELAMRLPSLRHGILNVRDREGNKIYPHMTEHSRGRNDGILARPASCVAGAR